MVSYPTVNAGGWLNENPEEPEGCTGAAGAGGFAPKVNTSGLLVKLKLEVLLPNWNTGPKKDGAEAERNKKMKSEFILSSKNLTILPPPLSHIAQDGKAWGGRKVYQKC